MMYNFCCFFLVLTFISCNSNTDKVEITMHDLEGKIFSFKDVKKREVSVFYFLAPECPLSQNYTKAINDVSAKFGPKGVESYAVFCGNVYSETEMKGFAEDYKLSIRCLKDVKYELAEYFNATITPEVFVLDKKGKVIYFGKIDNWAVSLGVKRQVTTEFYLKEALTRYLKNETILISKTEAVGCLLE